MSRLSAVFWPGLVLASGFATFMVKYAVQGIDDQVQRVRKQTVAEQQEIRVLTAEWTYLNQPERLADLNQRFLHLEPITAKQLQATIADIPPRAPALAAPAQAVAASPPSGTAQPAASGLLFAVAMLRPAPASVGVPISVVQTASSEAPASLDALFALVAEKR